MSDTIGAKFSCGGCGKSFTWKPDLAGKRVKCKCGTVMTVPADAPGSDSPDDEYDLAPVAEPVKPVHPPAPRPAAQTTGKPVGKAKVVATPSGGVAAVASPVLGYRQPKAKTEKDRFSADTLLDMKRDAYVPIVLLIAGLALSVSYYAIHYQFGMSGIAITTLGVGALTAFKALLLIGFAFAVAGPLGVGFGGIWTTVLKLAAIAVFSDGVTTWIDAGLGKLGAGGLATIISFPISLGVYWLLLIYLFSMDAGDSWLVVILLSVFDNLVRWVLLLLLLNSVLGWGGATGLGTSAKPASEAAVRIQELDDEGRLIEYGKWKTDGHQPRLPEIADGCYAVGAKNIWYEVSRDINGKVSPGSMIIELPKDKAKRAACFKVVNDYYKSRDPDFGSDAYKDDGQEYLEFMVQ